MRRILLALVALPLSCLAQSVTVNPSTDAQTAATESRATLQADPMPAPEVALPANPSEARSTANRANPGTTPGAPRASVPTASEQGYDPKANAMSAQAAADYQAQHTPRQLGEQVRQPRALDPVANNPQAEGWLANWTATLVRAGVPETKVSFEAHRLDRESFSAWAYRQILASHSSP